MMELPTQMRDWESYEQDDDPPEPPANPNEGDTDPATGFVYLNGEWTRPEGIDPTAIWNPETETWETDDEEDDEDDDDDDDDDDDTDDDLI